MIYNPPNHKHGLRIAEPGELKELENQRWERAELDLG
jgi:hypothetical protein